MRYELILMFVLLSLSVNAIDVYTFDRCNELEVIVNATEQIDLNEYWFTGCNETSKDVWKCTCSDGYVLELEHLINTVNVYNISMYYNYSNYVVSSGGSGGGSSRNRNRELVETVIIPDEKQPLIDYRTIYTTDNEPVENKEVPQEIEDDVITGIEDTLSTEIIDIPEETKGFNWLAIVLIIVGLLIIIFLIIYFINQRNYMEY